MESRSAILSEWSSLRWQSAQAESRCRSCRPFNSANSVRIACAATETQAKGINRPVRSSPNPTRLVGKRKRKRIPTGNRVLILHRSWRTHECMACRDLSRPSSFEMSLRTSVETSLDAARTSACGTLAFEWVVRNVGLRFVYYNGAGLHHPAHFVDCGLDVVQRIAFDGQNVGEITRTDCSQALFHAEQLCAVRRGGFQGLLGSHAGLDEPLQFTGVLAE